MTRGRKPHSTRRKKLEGNPGKRKLNRAEPDLPPLAPEVRSSGGGGDDGQGDDPFFEPPIELEGDEIGIKEWRRVVPLLSGAKLVSEGERGILIALCIQYSRYVEASKDLRDRGLIVDVPQKEENGTDRDGVDIIIRYAYPIQNPNLSIANKSLQFCLKIWSELGLTPSSRSRVSPIGDKKTEGDGFDEFD